MKSVYKDEDHFWHMMKHDLNKEVVEFPLEADFVLWGLNTDGNERSNTAKRKKRSRIVCFSSNNEEGSPQSFK